MPVAEPTVRLPLSREYWEEVAREHRRRELQRLVYLQQQFAQAQAQHQQRDRLAVEVAMRDTQRLLQEEDDLVRETSAMIQSAVVISNERDLAHAESALRALDEATARTEAELGAEIHTAQARRLHLDAQVPVVTVHADADQPELSEMQRALAQAQASELAVLARVGDLQERVASTTEELAQVRTSQTEERRAAESALHAAQASEHMRLADLLASVLQSHEILTGQVRQVSAQTAIVQSEIMAAQQASDHSHRLREVTLLLQQMQLETREMQHASDANLALIRHGRDEQARQGATIQELHNSIREAEARAAAARSRRAQLQNDHAQLLRAFNTNEALATDTHATLATMERSAEEAVSSLASLQEDVRLMQDAVAAFQPGPS
jgi:hypothetical protein